ncbi:vanadium-dependent haloperoxidase [Desulfoscipio gibsoniae]|uniref:PAP2 superfamily protein n=1 Tax=Desulfoscipio gibsoniae DSM 7213 TaxID=767817 RepID=R4KHS8_9FIRM|nr:vanadium-dependent haloperoxidase [Desulfoscipio gibsoniae]AGL02169.1 PAP2 superfamily protein [Desulfoscipio gibsoniae DSM 7213]
MSDETLSPAVKEVCQRETANTNLNVVECCEIGPTSARQRNQEAFEVRQDAAVFQRDLPLPGHPCNGDEDLFPSKIGNYSKGLAHNQLGEVNLNNYRDLIRALSTGDPDDLEFITLGGVTKLVNPQAAYAFDLAGSDSHHLGMIPAPAFSSVQIAGEMAELYWQALTRDVPFADYDTDPLTIAAASDLSDFSDFRGSKVNGMVTTGTLFRGNTPSDLVGPYISQFLWQDIPFGAKTIVQRYRTTAAGDDHLTSYQDWLSIQNGFAPATSNVFDPTPRYIRSGRDLGEYVHLDFSYQGVLGACLILLGFGQRALDLPNPYLRSLTQVGFATFGSPHILDLVARAARAATEAAWFQKWLVHRRLRPEEFGGRVQNLLTGAASYSINQELLDSQAVGEVFSRFDTYLLPQAYPEGCPAHPAYPAGHACIAGAGVTMLKAFFNESFVVPNPVAASSDGLSLVPFQGPPLTVGGELNKLAANISFGRDYAGIHWRSDGIEGLKLGEAVAIGILQDYRNTYNEDFRGFTLTKFDGTSIII